jgi:hypothetical protein
MSLKGRIRKLEKWLPKEDYSLTEFTYNYADPTEEEREVALNHTDGFEFPMYILYVPYDFKYDLENYKITYNWVMEINEELGVYYDGESLIKLTEKYDKDKCSKGSNIIEILEYHDFSEFIQVIKH